MAEPQIENGYMKIALELQDAFCQTRIASGERRVLDSILRKTYGWNKKEDKVSISQICELTKLSRRMVIYAIKNLEAKNIIIVKRGKTNGLNEINLISLQKNYNLWVVQEIDGSARKHPSYKATIQKQKEKYKNRVVQEIVSSARNKQTVVQEIVAHIPNLAPTKETITKDSITKEKRVRFVFSKPTVAEISVYCLEIGSKIDPQYFFDYQEARDWKFKGGQPMKDWKATLRTWKKNNFDSGGVNGQNNQSGRYRNNQIFSGAGSGLSEDDERIIAEANARIDASKKPATNKP